MRAFLLSVLLVACALLSLSEAANVLVICDTDIPPIYSCAKYTDALQSQGHVVMSTTSPLTAGSLTGGSRPDILVDSTFSGPTCNNIYTPTTIQEINDYLALGGPAFLQTERGQNNACNTIKLNIMNPFIENGSPDTDVAIGITNGAGPCVASNLGVLGPLECILTQPSDIAGAPITCADTNTFSNTLAAENTVANNNGIPYAGIWGSPGRPRIVTHSDVNWDPSGPDFSIFENYMAYLQIGCEPLTVTVNSAAQGDIYMYLPVEISVSSTVLQLANGSTMHFELRTSAGDTEYVSESIPIARTGTYVGVSQTLPGTYELWWVTEGYAQQGEDLVLCVSPFVDSPAGCARA